MAHIMTVNWGQHRDGMPYLKEVTMRERIDLTKLDPHASLLDALLLSIAKWKWKVLCRGDKEKEALSGLYIPELRTLWYQCGLCHRYGYACPDHKENCMDCPVAQKDNACWHIDSIWSRWNCAKSPRERHMFAQLMLSLLRQIYNQEVDKCST